MKIDIPRIVIAAPSSGSGKSTVTTGLMAVLAENHTVQGFKVGPDYIDPGYHTQATGRISRNLDTWMVPKQQVQATFARATQDAEIAIIEGVMGLYDGFNATTEDGSTAQAAKQLGAPVVLVIDVGKMARSAGAIALGYRDFDPELNLAGVICNRVGSPKHALWVTQAIEALGIPVLGCIPKSASLKIPERHLGLHMAQERTAEVDALIQACSSLFKENIDIDKIWQVAKQAQPLEITLPTNKPANRSNIRIAVARDEAFCFYYEDNLDLLRHAGAEIVFFSPLYDKELPDNISGIYLGGGYPELYAANLSANQPIITAIREASKANMPVYAECGGLMVLTEYLIDLEQQKHTMLGLIPGYAEMVQKLTMGYREIIAEQDTLLMNTGETARGHEFHYSHWIRQEDSNRPAYRIKPRIGETFKLEGYASQNLLASYVHVHFGSTPELAKNFVRRCAEWQGS